MSGQVGRARRRSGGLVRAVNDDDDDLKFDLQPPSDADIIRELTKTSCFGTLTVKKVLIERLVVSKEALTF